LDARLESLTYDARRLQGAHVQQFAREVRRNQENEMATITVEVPDSAFSALRRSPQEFAREMRIAAAIQWYQQTLISQGKAAEIAGLSRADFLDALFRAKVPASQVTIEELKEELESWQRQSAESSTPRP
jgi:predicted HTH domain antitoxin